MIDLYAPFDESFSNSIIASIVPECDGVTFSQSSLLFYVWASSLAEANTGSGLYDSMISTYPIAGQALQVPRMNP